MLAPSIAGRDVGQGEDHEPREAHETEVPEAETQLTLFAGSPVEPTVADVAPKEEGVRPSLEAVLAELERFEEFGTRTRRAEMALPSGRQVPVFLNEFWTARQRQASRLHEVSYRACFKPQLPRFFIERFTSPGDVVYDPFSGRGTTAVEAGLLGRVPWAADINPLSAILAGPRLEPVEPGTLERRSWEIDFGAEVEQPEDLLVFYHPETLQEICALRKHLLERRDAGTLDAADGWLRMVATNRLTGHSAGFFSVYTLPPNQATNVKAQKRINVKRNQVPPRRDVPKIILKKAAHLQSDLTAELRARLEAVRGMARFVTASADDTRDLPDDSVNLVVTSPPFLNAVDYRFDNWLRGWFCGIDVETLPIWQMASLANWELAMERVFGELHRLLVPGGVVAFEVGEVNKGSVNLEEHVCAAAERAGLEAVAVLINAQDFTKTSNCWGITNLERGTNTNRISLLRKAE